MSNAAPPPGPPAFTVVDVIRKASDAAFGRPLVTNVLRGQLAEAIVALTLEPDWSWCSADYSSWDFEHCSGLRLEVKQSAARQSWTRDDAPPSAIAFDIAPRKGRWENGIWVAEPGRAAHLYIFAHHHVADTTADHRDPRQWLFHVVRADLLPSVRRLTLARLRMFSEPVPVTDLRRCVGVAAQAVCRELSKQLHRV